MKYDATEICGAGEDCIGSLEIAISEIEGIEEYEEIVKILEEAKSNIEDIISENIEEANKIWDAERTALNIEYETSVVRETKRIDI